MLDNIKNKHIILFNCFLIMILNLIKGIIYKWTFDKFIIYVISFFIVIVIYFIIQKTYKLDPIIFFICAMLCILEGNWGNLSGATFVIFSFYCTRYKEKILILFAILILVIILKFIFFMKNSTILDTIEYLIGFEFVIFIYFNMIHPKEIFFINEEKTNIEIIKLLLKGYKNKEIGNKINLTENAITKRIEMMRKKYDCKNNEQLIYELIKKGGIIKT